jgi:hypothetical protein
MNFNPFKRNEESSFEQGLPVNKTIKNVSDQAQKQAKVLTNDIVASLYGISDKSSGDGQSDNKMQATNQASSPVSQQLSNGFPGIQTPDEMARYQQLQQQLRGEGKSDDEVKSKMTHSQNYFRPTIGNVEDEIEKEKRKREQREAERNKNLEDEAQQKIQAEQSQSESLPPVTGKGRNKMGMPPQKKGKTDMGLKMGQMKTETFRGSSG